jgi:uncharacterized protein YcbX
MISTAAALTGLGGALAIRQRTLTRKPRVMGVVTEISIHPIKSCGGLSLQACDIYAAGLEHDRRWVIAKLVLAEEDGGANGSSPSPSKTLCKVCFEREITTMRIPCEHSMCAECAAPRLCPYCKAPSHARTSLGVLVSSGSLHPGVTAQAHFMTQRQVARLALIHPSLSAAGAAAGAAGAAGAVEGERGGAAVVLTLSAAGMPPLPVPVRTEPDAAARGMLGGPIAVAVWGDVVSGVDQGEEAARWLTAFIEQQASDGGGGGCGGCGGGAAPAPPCRYRLVRMAPGALRPTSASWAPGHTVSWADGFPVLVASAASLAEINRRLVLAGAGAVPMDRFRPNLVLGGDAAAAAGGGALAPFAEDRWPMRSEITIQPPPGAAGTPAAAAPGGPAAAERCARLLVAKPCSRCMVPTIDQRTATYGADDQPNAVLREFRTGEQIGFTHLDQGFADATFFGQNCAVLRGAGGAASSGALGRVAVGDVLFASGW